MRDTTRLVHKLRRSFSSTITDEAADLIEDQAMIIRMFHREMARIHSALTQIQTGNVTPREVQGYVEKLEASIRPIVFKRENA